jgi:glycosyltransferase involved in cell wall biosynthesis
MSLHIDPRKVFVVIPAYNENAVITSVIEELIPFNFQIIIVDDGSISPLFPLIDRLPVIILRHSINMGQGAALRTGIEYALSKKAEYIVTFDADGQHNPAYIDDLLQPLLSKNFDITIGSRFMAASKHNMPLKRKLLLQFARYINFLFTGLLLSDAYNGMRAMSGSAAEAIDIQETGMAHSTEILSKIRKRKLRFLEIPVNINYTGYSLKKGLNIWSSFRIFFEILLNKFFK